MQRILLTIQCFLCLTLGVYSTQANAEKVMVAVAGNFTVTAKHLAPVFEARTGHKAVISYGSTGKLYAQIEYGAPFEVFLAADTKHPSKLAMNGKGVANTQFTYAKGKIALFSKKRDLPIADGLDTHNVSEIQKLAVANPKTAPYGSAAIEILKSLGVYEQIEDRIVLGDNLVQTYQFVYTANATAGFVSLSQVTNDDAGIRWVVPEEHYTPISQDAILLTKGVSNRAAIDFLTFLQSDEAKKIIQSYGYAVSETSENVSMY